MLKVDDAIVQFLEQYGQPQRYQVVHDFLREAGYVNFDITDMDRLANDGVIQILEDGVEANGDPMVHYAPLSYSAAVTP